jgi:deoxyribonuclease-4
LVHYNDSAAACGSCLDRHAAFGTGQIGLETMLKIAEHCAKHSYPMVIE